MSSLRVAFLVDPLTLKVKGGNHAPELARELLGRGHSVRGFGAPAGAIPRSGEEEAADTARTLVGFRPDVIVAYDALSPTALFGARAARKLRSALVLVEAGFTSREPVHTRALARVGEFLWGHYVRRTASAVIAFDPVAREHALADGFLPERIHVVPMGVDVGRFRPGLTSAVVARQRVRGRILLYVGALKADRGVRVLLEAFARTVGQRSDWSLVVAGDGPARERLRAQADRLGVAERVHVLPHPRREELPGLFGAATMLAVPALSDRVLGRHVGRSLACGVPALVSDLPRLSYLVEHETNGLVIAPDDVEAWSDAIARAAGSPVARRRWGSEARRSATERLAWPCVAEEIQDLLFHAVEVARERTRGRSSGRAARAG